LAGAFGHRDAILLYAAPLADELESVHGFEGANENRVGVSFRGDDDVEGPIHAVEEKHVGMSGRTEHGFGASRPLAACTVCGEIFRPSIRLALDDSSGSRSFGRTVYEDGANQFRRNLEHFAIVKRAR